MQPAVGVSRCLSIVGWERGYRISFRRGVLSSVPWSLTFAAPALACCGIALGGISGVSVEACWADCCVSTSNAILADGSKYVRCIRRSHL